MNKHLHTKEFLYHKLSSKKVKNGRVLIILHYDDFLQKRDFRDLFYSFETIVLFPLISKSYFMEMQSIWLCDPKSNDITLVYNPEIERISKSQFNIQNGRNRVLRTMDVLTFCSEKLYKIYVPENISMRNTSVQSLKYFGLFTRLVKKSFDFFGGSFLLIISFPFWLISYFRIKQVSPGPVLFRQERIGINNKRISVIKFRSMNLDAEKDGAQFSTKNDPRIFKYGRFMRATRIDELPQLINIIKGELSLIGPRPERQVFIDTFEECIPHYDERHTVKPGITGYAQVMYTYGSGVKDARHKLMYDLYYIQNWSVALECEIFIRTVWTIIFKRGV